MALTIQKDWVPLLSKVWDVTIDVHQGNSPQANLLNYLKLDKPIVFFDLETAGVNGKARYKIVEMSVIKFHPDGRIEPWTARINPELPIQKKAEDIHGINDIAVKDCPTFKHFAPTILEFFKDSHLGGFNILGFDITSLQKEFRDIGEDFSVKGKAIIDPMAIYHQNVPYVEGETRQLKDAVKFYCNKELNNAHHAKADIFATVDVLKGQFEMYPDMPQDVYELSKRCREKYYELSDFVDEEGKFVFNEEGEVIFNFGKKHIGKKLKEVAEVDKGYLYWILKEKEKKEDDFSFEIKELIKNALEKGIYPAREKEETKV